MLIPVILSGGSGTRLWPLSRAAYPKQFLALNGEQSLLQDTVTRLRNLPDVTAPIIVSNAEQRFIVAEQLRAINQRASDIVLEPCGRNTAPAVAIAAMLALRASPDAVLLVMPSDHAIQNAAVFQHLVGQARGVAETSHLVTFGIQPTCPHTGYGYIRRGTPLGDGAHTISAFVEKPDAARAADFLATGAYYWNSGIFIFKAAVYLEELAKLQPTIYTQCELALASARRDLDFLRLDEAAFTACPADSIDYAVMEHTQRAAVVEARDLGWNDIGSWTALADVVPSDDAGNQLLGDVHADAVRNCYIRSESRVVAAIGIEDLVIVETPDAVLVAHKDAAQDVKHIVDRLKAAERNEATRHQRVYRPWGSYEGIDTGERFQVKRIIVNPGASLSLQMHHHRAEHWVVVRGTAKVVNGEQTMLLTENQSTYIPVGAVHRLENPGRLQLELIEVQSGAYLGEDDIVRFDDQYGRTAA